MTREPERPACLTDLELARLSRAEFARLCGVTQRALRFYEARGLISPQRKGRTRAYSKVERHRIALILRAKRLGFSLTEIGHMIEVKDGAPPSQDLQLTAEKCLQQMSHLQRQMTNIMRAMADLQQIYLALFRKVGDPSER